MKKIIIGDHTYDIPDKVHILIEDLVKKNDRLRGKVRKAFMGEPVEREDLSKDAKAGMPLESKIPPETGGL